MDPDAVVALACSTLEGNSSQEAPMLRSSGHSISLQHGLRPQLNERTVPVLDALAEICVKDPTEDVVAVGLRVHLPIVQLVVATNDETPNTATIQHIQKVWDLLKEISERQFSERLKHEIDMGQNSPKIEEEKTLYNNLLREVYQYSYLKFFSRHKKYLKVFESFNAAWKKIRREQGFTDERQDLLKALGHFVMHLEIIASDIENYHRDNWKVSDAQMNEDFTPLLEEILEEANTILADRTACERWMGKVNLYPTNHLRRAIEKSVTFYRHINTLMRFAFSPRMRKMLDNTTFR